MDIQQPDQHTSGWITSLLRTAREAGVASDAPQLYRDFEDTVDQYIAALGAEEIDPTPFQQMFGVVVGEYLRKKLGMEWVIITDDYGTDLAIWRRLPMAPMCTPAPSWWWANASPQTMKRANWKASAPSSCWSPQLSCNAPRPMMRGTSSLFNEKGPPL